LIYIATHKAFNPPELEGYCPLQVGASTHPELDLGYQKDNIGDHISEKNPNFCELTGLYWIWKNTNDPYKGLVHYRRYFGKSNFAHSQNAIYSYDQMLTFLDDCDIVLPYIEYFKQDAREEILVSCCTPEIFDKLRRVISGLHPTYLSDFDRFFKNNQSTLFNMLFAKGSLFDSYCKWLFSILFELEKYVDLSKLDPYRSRLYGFLGERLLNVWVLHHHLKVNHLSVVNTESSFRQECVFLRRRITNQIVFKCSSLVKAGKDK
jgi:hypothetical protein